MTLSEQVWSKTYGKSYTNLTTRGISHAVAHRMAVRQADETVVQALVIEYEKAWEGTGLEDPAFIRQTVVIESDPKTWFYVKSDKYEWLYIGNGEFHFFRKEGLIDLTLQYQANN